MTERFKRGDRVEWDIVDSGHVVATHRGAITSIGAFRATVYADGRGPASVHLDDLRLESDAPHTPTEDELLDLLRDPEVARQLREEDELAGFWAQLEEESRDIFFSRHKKYGPRNIADAPGGALNGVVVRMHDKMARLRNFIEGDKTEYSDESLHDTLIDIGNYAHIARLLLKGQWPST